METPRLIDPQVGHIVHDRARGQILIHPVAPRLVQLGGRGIDQTVQGPVAVSHSTGEQPARAQERDHVVVGIRVVGTPAQKENRESLRPERHEIRGPIEGPDTDRNRPGSFLIVQRLEALPQDETSLSALRVPRVVVQRDVESRGPIGSLPEFRRRPVRLYVNKGVLMLYPGIPFAIGPRSWMPALNVTLSMKPSESKGTLNRLR